ncbi:MAG: hypothetical protein ABJC26_04540 [Gemmatimonadaceae bacterium]
MSSNANITSAVVPTEDSSAHELFPAPALALRVGVTGNRWHDSATPNAVRLNPDHRTSIENTIRVVLQQIHEAAVQVMTDDVDGRLYDKAVAPTISIVSPLAEGSDRLVASVARSFNPPWPLDVISPEDITLKPDLDPRIPLKSLWNAARSRLILDGIQNENESLLEVNRRLLWNCDVLIAIWDGKPAQGRAGTGYVIEQAAELGLPVIYIEGAPRTGPGLHNELHVFHVLEPTPAPHTEKDHAQSIHNLVARLVGPPQDTEIEEHEREKAHVTDYIQEFRREKVRGAFIRRFSGAAWGVMMKLLTLGNNHAKAPNHRIPSGVDKVSVSWEGESPDTNLNERLTSVLSPSFRRADYFATSYATRHRGSTVWLVMLAPLAIAFAWIAEQASGESAWAETLPMVCGIAEVLVLGAIVWIYANARRFNFHERWLDYRLLAERLRYLGFLWMMGRGSLVQRVPLRQTPEDAHTAWVNWWYRATVRQLPLPNVTFSQTYLRNYQQFLQQDVVLDQKSYMHRVFHTAEVAEKRVQKTTWLVFGLALFGAIAHVAVTVAHNRDLIHEPHWLKFAIGFVAIVLPGLGAALHAFASNLGLPEQTIRSASTIRALDVIEQGLNATQIDKALASIEISDLAQQTASALGDDLFGWRVDYLIRPTPQPG